MNYTVQYFIDKFEAIPEDKWCVGAQSDGNGNHCALGWCNEQETRTANKGEFSALWDLFINNGIFGTIPIHAGVAYVNNGMHHDYPQPTPKQRILAALYDIKEMQEPTITDLYSNISKSLAVLPVSETSDLLTALTSTPLK